jgi:hypothetical protein
MDATIWQKLRMVYFAFTQYHEVIVALEGRSNFLKELAERSLVKSSYKRNLAHSERIQGDIRWVQGHE